MSLSIFQKEIVDAILQKKVTDIGSFIKIFCDIYSVDNSESWLYSNYGFIESEFIYVPKNDAECIERVDEFLDLLKYLDELKLIYFKQKLPGSWKYPIFKPREGYSHNYVPHDNILIRLEGYEDKDILISHGLKDFVMNNYLSKNESNNSEVKKNNNVDNLIHKVKNNPISVIFIFIGIIVITIATFTESLNKLVNLIGNALNPPGLAFNIDGKNLEKSNLIFTGGKETRYKIILINKGKKTQPRIKIYLYRMLNEEIDEAGVFRNGSNLDYSDEQEYPLMTQLPELMEVIPQEPNIIEISILPRQNIEMRIPAFFKVYYESPYPIKIYFNIIIIKN